MRLRPGSRVCRAPSAVAAVVMTLAMAATGSSSSMAAPSSVRLRSRTIVPKAEPATVRAQIAGTLDAARTASARKAEYLIVQLGSSPGEEGRARLKAAGVEIQGYIPDNAFVAKVMPGTRATDLIDLGVTWMEPLTIADKVAPSLAGAFPGLGLPAVRGALPAHARLADGRLALYVEFHRDVELTSGVDAITREVPSATVAGRLKSLNGVVIHVDPDLVAALAACTEVKWVEPLSPVLGDLNGSIRQVIGSDRVQGPPYYLNGLGVSVLVYDGGLVCDTQVDLAPRVIQGENGFASTHATHVAGTLAGSGISSAGKFRGVAPGVEIISYAYESCTPLCLYNNPQDMEANYEEAVFLHGVDFASNSIGANIAANGYDCSLLGDYENTARLLDAIARGSLGRPVLSFWAAGNERQGSARCGDDYFTTGVPATAKNTIVVGATYSDTGDVASFSSMGPVDDGRMRPDLTAPGCELGGDGGVTSLRACVGHTVYCGTSMATPAVAGAAALVLERLRSSPHGDITTPAAMKAILSCSARDIANPGPDFMTGYGEVDVPQAIALVDSGTIIEGRLSHGELFTRVLEVPEGQTRLRAVLAWDDEPGEPLAFKNLVNDLDLRLVAPDGAVHHPFVLDPFAPGEVASTGVNRRDPSEMVEVEDPEPGEWRLEVQGFDVPMSKQSFAVAAEAAYAVVESVDGNAAPSTPGRTALGQNVPNPFNPTTTIRFEVTRDGPVTLRITDFRGSRVRVLASGWHQSGTYVVQWDGRNDRGRPVASGTYLYALEERGALKETRRMVLLK